VRVINPQDIYEPIVDILRNQGGTGGQPLELGSSPEPRGKLDQLVEQNAENIERITMLADANTGTLNQSAGYFSTWQTASFGSASSIPLPLNNFNPGFPAQIEIPSFFSIIRRAILWLLTACWWMVAVKSVMATRIV
jgi:hypothetical protein